MARGSKNTWESVWIVCNSSSFWWDGIGISQSSNCVMFGGRSNSCASSSETRNKVNLFTTFRSVWVPSRTRIWECLDDNIKRPMTLPKSVLLVQKCFVLLRRTLSSECCSISFKINRHQTTRQQIPALNTEWRHPVIKTVNRLVGLNSTYLIQVIAALSPTPWKTFCPAKCKVKQCWLTRLRL